MPTPDEVLEFWFADTDEPNFGTWFSKDPNFDSEIEEKFGDAVERAIAGGFKEWEDDPESLLALVILLDQFTRNIYRDTPRAFAGDARALQLARLAMSRGMDERLPVTRRAFLYMPLEHAESHEAQEESIAAFDALLRDAGEKTRGMAEAFLDYAQKHKAIIDRFGRYPHRNEILGRETTPEEAEFLEQPGSSF